MEGVPDAGYHLRRQERVTAYLEEIVVDTYRIKPEHVLPDLHKFGFLRCAWRHKYRFPRICSSGLSGLHSLPIQLTVWRPRKLLQCRYRCRDHIGRQGLAKVAL